MGLQSPAFHPAVDYYKSRGIACGLYGVGWLCDEPPIAVFLVGDSGVEVPQEIGGVTILTEEISG
jgi:hypothetical protein